MKQLGKRELKKRVTNLEWVCGKVGAGAWAVAAAAGTGAAIVFTEEESDSEYYKKDKSVCTHIAHTQVRCQAETIFKWMWIHDYWPTLIRNLRRKKRKKPRLKDWNKTIRLRGMIAGCGKLVLEAEGEITLAGATLDTSLDDASTTKLPLCESDMRAGVVEGAERADARAG